MFCGGMLCFFSPFSILLHYIFMINYCAFSHFAVPLSLPLVECCAFPPFRNSLFPQLLPAACLLCRQGALPRLSAREETLYTSRPTMQRRGMPFQVRWCRCMQYAYSCHGYMYIYSMCNNQAQSYVVVLHAAR